MRAGSHPSEKSRRKMSVTHTGVPRGPHSEKTKRKIGIGNKGKLTGRIHSEEMKQRISRTLRGRIITPEARQKLSKVHKRQFCSSGHNTHLVGRSRSNCDMCQYLYNAKKKNLPFTLTEQQFVDLINQDCVYRSLHCNKTGIDRINSSLGYTEDNVQPMCFNHNRLKTTFDFQLFEALCTSVYIKTQGSKGLRVIYFTRDGSVN